MNKFIFALFLLLPVFATAQDGRCKKIKADNTQCKQHGNFVSKKTGYCHVHDPATPRCGVKKKDGKPCQMVVKRAGIACRFHSGGQ